MKIKSLFWLMIAFASPSFANTYQLDAEHSYVGWQVEHLGFSKQVGKWYAQGNLTLDKELTKSHVEVKIMTDQIITGLTSLDGKLKSNEFLDSKRYPEATFISHKVHGSLENLVIEGDLTLHGVTKSIHFTAKLNKQGLNPITKRQAVGFSGKTRLKRSDFGMNAFIPMVSDEVEIMLEVEAQAT